MLNKLKTNIYALPRLFRSRDVPSDLQASDLFLVEFPKSGVTWLSTMLANAALIRSGMTQRATFFSVSQYIPDIHVTAGLVGNPAYALPPFRMIKSHAEFNKHYQHTIYLVRHPGAVMRSFYTFLREHRQTFSNPDEFLRSKQFGLPAWKRHVSSWLASNNQSARLHLVRYEDLLSDPVSALGSLNSNLGLGFETDELSQAIQLSSMENMQQSERLYASTNPRYQLSFVGGEREEFPQSTLDMIESECLPELRLAGYA